MRISCLIYLSQSATSNALHKPTLSKNSAWSLWKIKNRFFHYYLVMTNRAAYLCKFPSSSPQWTGSGGGGSLEQSQKRFLQAIWVSRFGTRVQKESALSAKLEEVTYDVACVDQMCSLSSPILHILKFSFNNVFFPDYKIKL